jgi:CRP-like cAMP-binding protein
MFQDRYLQHLSRVPLFSTCSKDELHRIARQATPMRLEAGDTLVREGGSAREFFVIERGQVEVTRGGNPVAKLGPGDHFGELALLHRAPRDATVTTLTPVDALVLTAREFEVVLREAPRMTRKLLTRMAERLQALDTTS